MMKSLKGGIGTALKGYAMGAANVVPGVSGGTIALLTGIYPPLVASLDSLTAKQTWTSLLHGRFKEFWKCVNGNFLVALFAGVLVSVFSLAKLMTFVLEHYPILTWAFFFGLILASSWMMFRDVKGWGIKEVLFAIAGLVLGVVVCTLSPTETPDNYLFIFICGAVSVCTMILPGISGSFVLLIMGKYNYIMDAISGMNIPVLAVFALGCLVGLLAFAKLLRWLLDRFEKQTMLVLLGFVIGSLVKVWPWNDMQAITEAQVLRGGLPAPIDMQIPGAILCCIAGIALVLVLEMSGRKK